MRVKYGSHPRTDCWSPASSRGSDDLSINSYRSDKATEIMRADEKAMRATTVALGPEGDILFCHTRSLDANGVRITRGGEGRSLGVFILKFLLPNLP